MSISFNAYFKALCLLFFGVLLLLSAAIGSSSAANVRDEFNRRSYSNNNGSANWASDWLEINDDNSPTDGVIQVRRLGAERYVLSVRLNNRGARRQIDLTGATSVNFTFDYRRLGMERNDSVRVEVSADGGATWVEIDRLFGSGSNDAGFVASTVYDLSSYAGPTTQIRFVASTNQGNDRFYVDNVNIDYSVGPPKPVAHWPLDGNAEEAVNGRHAVPSGPVVYDPARVCDGFSGRGQSYLQADIDSLLNLAEQFTVTAWLNPSSLSVPGHDSLYSFVSKDTNVEAHVQSNGAVNWWWGNGSLTSPPGLIVPGGWAHIALVHSRSGGFQRLYVNGNVVASSSQTSPMPTNNDPFFIGTDIDTPTKNELAYRRFHGLIDEVKIFDGPLTDAQIAAEMALTRNCGPEIDHFRIVHDGSALTCAPEAVEVRACGDAACTPENRVTTPIQIALSPSGWVQGDTQTLNDGQGTFALRRTTPAQVLLGVTTNDVAVNNPTQCQSPDGDCLLDFYQTGFLFDLPDLDACVESPEITMTAVRLDETTQKCTAVDSFDAGVKPIQFKATYVDPATGTRAPTVNGTAISLGSTFTEIPLEFTAAEAQFRVLYSDAGRLVLDARYEGTGDETGLVMQGSDDFVAVPARLRVTATKDGTLTLDNANSSGEPKHTAGVPFEVKVEAVCADGTLTPNFRAETDLETTAPFKPAIGTKGGLSQTSVAADAYAAGVAVVETAYSEVGTVTLQATARDYAATGRSVTGVSQPVGRFIPAYFSVNTNNPELETACGSFSYLGQPLAYGTSPQATVTAYNAMDNVTTNYVGLWWKISPATVAYASGWSSWYQAQQGQVDASQSLGPTISVLGAGQGTITFDGTLRMERDGQVAPFDAEIQLAFAVGDSDGVAASISPVTFGEATPGNGIPFGGGKEVRFGRLQLENAYGSELSDLPIPAHSDYFDGVGFVRNRDDQCTVVTDGMISVLNTAGDTVAANQPIEVNNGQTTSALWTHRPLNQGEGGFYLTAPGEGGVGDLWLALDLATLPWLQYDWDNEDGSGDGPYDDNPASLATFGLFKGNPRIIYRRESVD